jgi:hypothetical protein
MEPVGLIGSTYFTHLDFGLCLAFELYHLSLHRVTLTLVSDFMPTLPRQGRASPVEGEEKAAFVLFGELWL